MASKRRPPSNPAFELLQPPLAKPAQPSGVRPASKRATHRARTPSAGTDALVLLQGLLDTPLAPNAERRRPVSLRVVARHPKSVGYTGPTWFDTLLQRSSQLLMIGALLVLGYWFVNVPLNNWLHPRRIPVARALSTQPSATATRTAPTQAAHLASSLASDIVRSSHQRAPIVPTLRAPSVPSPTIAEAQADTQPFKAGQSLPSPSLAVQASPTVTPPPAAAPSPTAVFMRPTITPVQLGIVSKPSPAPIERAATIPQLGAPTRQNGAAALPRRLIIPVLGLDVPIKEVFIVNDQWQVAEYAAGYLNGSGLPGVPGNLALSGHAGLYGAVFANLGALNPGDNIYVDAANIRYRYRLRTASTVWPNQVEVLDSTETPTMTLITCTNWDTQRLVAQADFVDSSPVPNA